MASRIYTLLATLLFIFPKDLISQEPYLSNTDKQLFNAYATYIAQYEAEQMGTILEKTAEFFLKTPYLGGTLDQNEDERLVINFSEMDCVTYVENVIALSLAVHNHNLSQAAFIDNLKQIRYRNKEIVDYSSRIHYTSDWIFENQKNNLLENISEKLEGKKETKQINFMSSHQSAYKQLANDDVMLDKIAQYEKIINNRGGFYYLPKNLIDEKAKDIPHMSVIGIVTAIPGLDTSHVGFAYHKEGKLTFIHASSLKMEVIIDEKTLSEYCLSQKNCKGVIVARVKDK